MSWARNSVGERGDNIGLPDVTTADNGKIMEVESGEWKLKEGSGGGGGIPAPADPSNGDVLTYSSTDSAWVAAAPGGGGGDCKVYTVHVSKDLNDNWITDKTAAEILAAVTAGCFINIVSYDGASATDYAYFTSFMTSFSYLDEGGSVVYSMMTFDEFTYYATSGNSIMSTESPL